MPEVEPPARSMAPCILTVRQSPPQLHAVRPNFPSFLLPHFPISSSSALCLCASVVPPVSLLAFPCYVAKHLCVHPIAAIRANHLNGCPFSFLRWSNRR